MIGIIKCCIVKNSKKKIGEAALLTINRDVNVLILGPK